MLRYAFFQFLGLFADFSYIEGVGEDEFKTRDQLHQRLKISFVKLTVHDCDKNDKVIAIFMFHPSPLSRSVRPIYSGDNNMIKK